MTLFQYKDTVRKDWVDYNGHMNDAAYAAVFSLAADNLMQAVGLDETGRRHHSYTLFTLETHLCYLQEAHQHETLYIDLQLMDIDTKRIHAFFFMKNDRAELLATSEQMLMGIDQTNGKPAPFPKKVQSQINSRYDIDREKEKPDQIGRIIGIKKR